MTVSKIPEGYHTLAPYLIQEDPLVAIEFYKKAFGAIEHVLLEMPDGKVGHAEIKIGNSVMMMGAEFPEMECHAPSHYGGSSVSLFIYVEDCEAVFKQAVETGATVMQEPTEMFWGDMMAKVQDPFGYQ